MTVLSPLKELSDRLDEVVDFSPQDLARMLSGDLPALGSDYQPAQHIWRALRTDCRRQEQETALAKLCAELLRNVPKDPDRDYLYNLFLLGQMLQKRKILFAAARELDLTLSGVGRHVKRELRLLLILNQTDPSLRDRWHRILKGEKGTYSPDDLFDAFLGLMWLRPSEDEDGPEVPLDDIRQGLPMLAEALADNPKVDHAEAERYLRSALRALRHVYPNDRWAEWLRPDYAGWHILLQHAALDEVPGLRTAVGEAEDAALGGASPLPLIRAAFLEALHGSDPPALWQWLEDEGVIEWLRGRLERRDLANLGVEIIAVGPRMRGAPAPGQTHPYVFLNQWVEAVKRLAGYQAETYVLRPEEQAEEGTPEPSRRGRPPARSAYQEYQSVLQQIEAIAERLKHGDEDTARQWADQLVVSQEAYGTPPSLVAKSLANLSTRARTLGRLQVALEWAARARKVAPDDPVARTGLAEVLKARHQLQEAEDLYRKTITEFPEDVVARNGLAEVLKARGHLQEAEDLYRKTITDFPEDVVARNGLASLLGACGRFEEALQLLRVREPPESRHDWMDYHLRAMLLLRAALAQGTEDSAAIEMLQSGANRCPFPDQLAYFCSALAFYALRCHEYERAEQVLAPPDEEREALGKESALSESQAVLELARLHWAAATEKRAAAEAKYRVLRHWERLSQALAPLNRRYGLEGPPADAKGIAGLERALAASLPGLPTDPEAIAQLEEEIFEEELALVA